MYKRDRPKQVIVESMSLLNISYSAVVQIGDVYGPVDPFDYAEAYAGYRGAVSFVTSEFPEPVDTRLHYANQMDEDVLDTNLYGENVETFRPNTRGVQAR